jgi:hypothetical protein
MALEDLSDLDLESSAMACRALAHVRRKDAEGSEGTSYREIFLRDAERLTALAARYQAELDRRRTQGQG